MERLLSNRQADAFGRVSSKAHRYDGSLPTEHEVSSSNAPIGLQAPGTPEGSQHEGYEMQYVFLVTRCHLEPWQELNGEKSKVGI